MSEADCKNCSVAIFFAISAAALFALSAPFSKMFLEEAAPMMTAGLLYLGAGIGMVFIWGGRKVIHRESKEIALTKKDRPYVIGMILLDIAAPISLMFGLTMTTAANASLLNNFEIVATSVIALVVFKEVISKRLWLAILLVTIASILLTVDDFSNVSFSFGSLFVLAACVFWGLENNCTRMISDKDPLEIVLIKGLFSGFGALVIAHIAGESLPTLTLCLMILLLGFVSYGMSIYYYVSAQRTLGAAKTSTFYAIAPFLGVGFSFILFHEMPSAVFIAALIIMIIGAFLATEYE